MHRQGPTHAQSHQRYPPPHPPSHPHHHQPHPPPSHSHVASNDFRLPPLKSLNFPYKPPSHDTANPPPPEQQPYSQYDVPQDVAPQSAPPPPAQQPNSTTVASSNGASYYSYPTPSHSYVHRPPYAFQTPSEPDSWNTAHSHSLPPNQATYARPTAIVPTSLDAAAAGPSRHPPHAFPPSNSTSYPHHPKNRPAYPPPSPSPYTPGSHPYPSSYPHHTPSSSVSTPGSGSYASYSTSPTYPSSATSPTYSSSTSPTYPHTASATAPPNYPSHHQYTPASAYPPPSPTPTPTQASHPHSHSPAHYVPPTPPTASGYPFEDTRPVQSDSRYVLPLIQRLCTLTSAYIQRCTRADRTTRD